MEKYLLDYEAYLRKQNMAANTLENYKRDVKLFFEYLTIIRQDIFNVDLEDANRYILELRNSKKSLSTIKRNISSLKKFYRFLIESGKVESNPFNIKSIDTVKRSNIKYLSYKEVEKLIEAPDTSTVKGIRDRAMIELMYGTGIKVTELISLKLYDIKISKHYILFYTGSTQRFLPLGKYCISILKKYLTVRDEIDKYNQNYLFLNIKGQPLTRQGFWKIIKSYAKDINIDKDINCTILRHSFAIHLLENGADISVVQKLLGLTYLNSAEIYKSVVKNKRIMEEYMDKHPRA